MGGAEGGLEVAEGAVLPGPKRLTPERSTRIARRLFTPVWLRFGVVGEMEIPGRSSGARRKVVVRPFMYEGTWYLCSFAGETDWVRNLRSAGRGRFSHKGRSTQVWAVEIVGEGARSRVDRFSSEASGPCGANSIGSPTMATTQRFGSTRTGKPRLSASGSGRRAIPPRASRLN